MGGAGEGGRRRGLVVGLMADQLAYWIQEIVTLQTGMNWPLIVVQTFIGLPTTSVPYHRFAPL